MEKTLVAEKVSVRVGKENRVVDIYVNERGNLELDGIGHVMYDMLDDEIEFTPIGPSIPKTNVRE